MFDTGYRSQVDSVCSKPARVGAPLLFCIHKRIVFNIYYFHKFTSVAVRKVRVLCFANIVVNISNLVILMVCVQCAVNFFSLISRHLNQVACPRGVR